MCSFRVSQLVSFWPYIVSEEVIPDLLGFYSSNCSKTLAELMNDVFMAFELICLLAWRLKLFIHSAGL